MWRTIDENLFVLRGKISFAHVFLTPENQLIFLHDKFPVRLCFSPALTTPYSLIVYMRLFLEGTLPTSTFTAPTHQVKFQILILILLS